MQEFCWGGEVTGKGYSLAARGLFDAPTVASTDGDERSVRVLEVAEGNHAKESRTRVHAASPARVRRGLARGSQIGCTMGRLGEVVLAEGRG